MFNVYQKAGCGDRRLGVCLPTPATEYDLRICMC